MIRFEGLKLILLSLFAFASCSQLKPEQVQVPEFPDLKEVIGKQAKLLAGSELEKTVSLDNQSETNTFTLDSAGWADELSFLKEINPNQPEYVGAFDKTEEGNTVRLALNKNTNGELKEISYIKIGDIYSGISGTFHEDRDVYVHHREIEVQFSDGLIQSFEVVGYQKMILKDTVWFSIGGRLLN